MQCVWNEFLLDGGVRQVYWNREWHTANCWYNDIKNKMPPQTLIERQTTRAINLELQSRVKIDWVDQMNLQRLQDGIESHWQYNETREIPREVVEKYRRIGYVASPSRLQPSMKFMHGFVSLSGVNVSESRPFLWVEESHISTRSCGYNQFQDTVPKIHITVQNGSNQQCNQRLFCCTFDQKIDTSVLNNQA